MDPEVRPCCLIATRKRAEKPTQRQHQGHFVRTQCPRKRAKYCGVLNGLSGTQVSPSTVFFCLKKLAKSRWNCRTCSREEAAAAHTLTRQQDKNNYYLVRFATPCTKKRYATTKAHHISDISRKHRLPVPSCPPFAARRQPHFFYYFYFYFSITKPAALEKHQSCQGSGPWLHRSPP